VWFKFSLNAHYLAFLAACRAEAVAKSCVLTLLLSYEYVQQDIAKQLPVNSMRNHALLLVQTPLVALLDVDLMASASMAQGEGVAAAVAQSYNVSQANCGTHAAAVAIAHRPRSSLCGACAQLSSMLAAAVDFGAGVLAAAAGPSTVEPSVVALPLAAKGVYRVLESW
jgi:hypothetical protein